MASSQPSPNTPKYTLTYEDWIQSDDEVIAKMNQIILALKNREINAATAINSIDLGSCNATSHIFGDDGNHFCRPDVVSTWLSLLVLLASSENVTGGCIAGKFNKCCSECMVYIILMAVACFRRREIAELAFDFFRHVLADPKGEILELHEIIQFALFLDQHIPCQQNGTKTRFLCLAIENAASYADTTTSKGKATIGIHNLVAGLAALCTSQPFIADMKTNSKATIEILKKSMSNSTFSSEFVREKWHHQ